MTIEILQVPQALNRSLTEISHFIVDKVSRGECTDHLTYLSDGTRGVDKDLRGSYRVTPDLRFSVTHFITVKAHDYASRVLGNNSRNLILTQSEFMYYPKGAGVGLHSDDHVVTVSGATVRTDDRYRGITCLLYLNSAFGGGDLVFPKQSLTVRPKSGMLVLFPSTAEFPHLVQPVLSGYRTCLQRVYGLMDTEDSTTAYTPPVLNESCC
jgi:hypothetical protein